MNKSNNLLYDHLVYSGLSDSQTSIELIRYNKAAAFRNRFERADDVFASMNKHEVNWIHVNGLRNVEEIGQICYLLGLQTPAIQDILNPLHISKIEETNNLLLIVLDAYGYNENMQLEREHFTIVLGSSFVLSFEEGGENRFELVKKAVESDLGVVRDQKSDYLFNLLVSMVVDSYLEVLELQQSSLLDMEDLLMEFNRTPKDTGQQIQRFRKDYSRLKKSVSPLREHFSRVLLAESNLIGKGCIIYFRDTYDHLQQVSLMMDANRETLVSLVDLYLSNNDVRMNQIMKQLTVVSTIFIPLTFLAGVWGMNFRNMPELAMRNGYPFAWGAMIAVGLVFFFWLRRKKMF